MNSIGHGGVNYYTDYFSDDGYVFGLNFNDFLRLIKNKYLCFPFNMIIFVQAGELIFEIDKERHYVHQGDVVIVKQQSIIDIKYSKNYLAQNVYFDIPFNDELFAETIHKMMAVFDDDVEVLRFNNNLFNKLLDKLQTFSNRTKVDEKTNYVHLWLDLIFTLTQMKPLSDYSNRYIEKEDFILNMVNQVEKFLNVNYKDDITTYTLADEFSISRPYLCRIFKDVTSFSINKYLNIIRIERACVLLESSEDQIIEVAYNVGYRSVSQFNRQFTSLMHTTPSNYRNRIKINPKIN